MNKLVMKRKAKKAADYFFTYLLSLRSSVPDHLSGYYCLR